MGFCVRKSGSSERVAYGPKPRENALSRVLSAPHSPDDFSRMDDGAVGSNPLNGAFPGVQATLHSSLSHPPIRCHHTPRATKRLGRPFLSDCVASATTGRTPRLVVVRCWQGDHPEICFGIMPANSCLPCIPDCIPTRGHCACLPHRIPSTPTNLPYRPCRAGEREGLWGVQRRAGGAGTVRVPRCALCDASSKKWSVTSPFRGSGHILIAINLNRYSK